MLAKVSILIPLFNSEKYIAETLESAINQTWPYKEIIVVDDSSTDNSFEIAKNFESDTVRIYKQENKGACAARNKAFELSHGDYIQYLDADDLLSTNKLELQVNELVLNPGKIAVCPFAHFYDNPKVSKLNDPSYLFSTDYPDEFLINLWGGKLKSPGFISQHCWLSPRTIIEAAGKWNEDLIKDQDGEFFARVLLQSKGIVFVPGAFSYYRVHLKGSNISSNKRKESYQSMMMATALKGKYLFQINSGIEAKIAISTLYKLISIDAFPKYKHIYHEARLKSWELYRAKYVPKLGGIIIESIKNLFGWRTARYISYHLHSMNWLTGLISRIRRI